MDQQQKIFKFRFNEIMTEKILLWLLIVICLLITARIFGILYQRHEIARAITKSMAFLNSQHEKSRDYFESYATATDKLKEKGIFVLEKPKPSPPQVAGILGDSALISGKWCRVGDEQAGAKVIKIEPTQITILWEGKEMQLAPLLASRPESPSEPPKKQKEQPKPTAVAKEDTTDAEVSTEPKEAAADKEDPLAWLGIEISDEVRSYLLKMFEAMPADQAEQGKQQWAQMSDEEKNEAINELQQMIDSGEADRMLEEMNN